MENIERGGIEDVLILIPPSVICLGNMGMFVRLMFLFFFFKEGEREREGGSNLSVFEPAHAQNVVFLKVFLSVGMQHCYVYRWFGK